jgi:hypothetical protein
VIALLAVAMGAANAALALALISLKRFERNDRYAYLQPAASRLH